MKRKNKVYVLDAYAILAFLEEEKGGDMVRDLLDTPGIHLYISVVNFGEVYYTILRERGREAAEIVERDLRLSQHIHLVDAPWERAKMAGEFKARGGISYADCFAAALAAEKDIPLLTGDKEFEKVSDKIVINWIE